jgi:hypothetical protein
MSCRTRFCKRFFLICSLLAMGIAVLGLPQPAFTQTGVDDPNGPFQLEGNATTDTSVCFQLTSAGALLASPPCPSGYALVTFGATTDDWQTALPYGSHTADGLAVATSFVTDTFNSSNDASFFGGGSKDTLGISTGAWEWQNTSNQGKADIEHAYAAAFKAANGHTFIYFGMDRFDNSGDTTGGFWFFQDSSVNLSNTKKGGGMLFSGHHTNNDLLIVANYGTGGATPTVETFTWVCSGTGATCDSTGVLTAGTSAQNAAAQCNPTTGTSSFCAITNGTSGLTAPWGFSEKHGATTFQAGEFLEGGIDLETIFGGNVPCFTTFMAETRASTSPTSSLADLTPPVSFPLCGIKVTKSCNGNGVVSNNGNTVTYSWTVTATNTGIGSLFDVTVIDTLPDGVTENVPLVTDPNSLGSKASVSGTVNFVVNCSAGVCTGAETGGGPVPNPLSVTNTADVQAFTGANSTGTKIVPSPDVPQTSSCQASAPGALTVTKHCDATHGGPVLVSKGGFVVVDVPFTATVCNGEPAGTGEAVNNITLSDSPTANTLSPSTITSLAPGACVNTVKGDYFPSAVDAGSNGLIAGRYFFTDTLTATGTGAIKGDTVTNSGAVSCPICPSGECDGPLP